MIQEKVIQGLKKVREFYFESGKNDILRKHQGRLRNNQCGLFNNIKGWETL